VLISAHRAATGKEISVDVFEAAYPGWTPDRAPTPCRIKVAPSLTSLCWPEAPDGGAEMPSS
jgi:hypothetical protein